MAGHPAIPRGEFVKSAGQCTNWPLLKVRVSAQHVEIIPAPVPILNASFLSVSLAAIGFGIGWYLWGNQLKAMAVTVAAYCGLVAFATVLVIRFVYRAERRRGCVFRFHRETGQVELPELGHVFQADCRFTFIFLHSDVLLELGDEHRAQLQLLVEKEGQAQRFGLAEAAYRRTLAPLVREICLHVPFTIHEQRS